MRKISWNLEKAALLQKGCFRSDVGYEDCGVATEDSEAMKKRPEIGDFLDEEEKQLFEIIEKDDYQPGPSHLTPQRLATLQAAARATINEQRTKISLRLPKSDLERLKARALREGMPYQTLIGSILHKAVSG